MLTAAQGFGVFATYLLRLGHLDLGLARPALDDRGPKQARRIRSGQVVADRHSPGGLTGDRHFVWVAAEFVDVVPDPTQCRLLVGQAVIAGIPQCGVGQKTERAQPVVDGDDDDASPDGKPLRVIDIAGPPHETAAVDPHHDR
nr:hypothetical protein CPGR_05014 [Mycolicibacter nonchromogenicus]